eukprot:jgi/Chlat1/7308/Chrsp58S06945
MAAIVAGPACAVGGVGHRHIEKSWLGVPVHSKRHRSRPLTSIPTSATSRATATQTAGKESTRKLTIKRHDAPPKNKRTSNDVAAAAAVLEASAAEAESGSDSSQFARYRALVLDVSYKPIEVVNWQRAIILDLFDKVDVLEYYDQYVRAAREVFAIPAVVRVHVYVSMAPRTAGRISLNRNNVILRDKHTCQYCGSTSDLTIDHLIPVSRGGQWTWDNLVTACGNCNMRKGNKSVEAAGLTLRAKPREPSELALGVQAMIESGRLHSFPDEWLPYLPSLKRGSKAAASTQSVQL